MELIVAEVVGAGLDQEFTTTQSHSIERIRCHICFMNIDKATNPGDITLKIYDSTPTLLATKTYTFTEIETITDAADAAWNAANPNQTPRNTLGNALSSTNAEWHGYLSFVWDQPVNIRPGVYTLNLSANYTFTADTNWIGWIKEHDNMKYQTYDGTSFPTLEQGQVPHSFEVYTYNKISDL